MFKIAVIPLYNQDKEGLVDDDFMITVESTQKFLQGSLDKFADHIKKYNSNII